MKRGRLKKRLLAVALCAMMFFAMMSNAGDASRVEAASGKWKKDSQGWWYSYSNGSYAKKQWLKIGGKWYYFKANGYVQTGWKKLSGKWYYFSPGGVMQTGWKKLSGKWYHFDGNGVMQTGWQKIKNKYYYFRSGGEMASNVWIGNSCLGSDGAWIQNASTDWVKKYKAEIETFNEEHDESWPYEPWYVLDYVDNDSTPELMMGYSKFGNVTVITYKGGKLIKQQLVSWNVQYIPRSGLILDTFEYKGEGMAAVYKLSSGKFTHLGGGGLSFDRYIERELRDSDYECTWNGKSVSKATFDKEVNKLYNNHKGSTFGNEYHYSDIMSKLNGFLK